MSHPEDPSLKTKKQPSRRWRTLTLASGALFLAGAVWRVIIAVRYYHLSLAIFDDPSIRELEQVRAMFEGVFAMVLAAHAGALIWLSRNPWQPRWPVLLGAAAVCGAFLGGALLKLPVFALPGLYPIAVVFAGVALARSVRFDWISLYLGALAGGAIAYYGTWRTPNAVVGLFVVGPCIVYALIGAAAGRLIKQRDRI